MSGNCAKDCRSAVIPSMQYRDAHKAIDWLERAFGFERQAVYEGPGGTIAHAQLVFGNGMVMLSSAQETSDWGRMMTEPSRIEGKNTSTLVLIVTDATAVYGRAKLAGAEIVQELAEMPYGGMAFGCKDLEGYLWSIGEYDPWA